jgi:hypothetical protein
VFCLYLFDKEPTSYVLKKYVEAHESANLKLPKESDLYEDMLIKIAVLGKTFTRIIDTYTSVFSKASLIRKKLILLLAIIESSDQSNHQVECISDIGKPFILLRIALNLISFMFILSASALVFFPIDRIARLKHTSYQRQ